MRHIREYAQPAGRPYRELSGDEALATKDRTRRRHSPLGNRYLHPELESVGVAMEDSDPAPGRVAGELLRLASLGMGLQLDRAAGAAPWTWEEVGRSVRSVVRLTAVVSPVGEAGKYIVSSSKPDTFSKMRAITALTGLVSGGDHLTHEVMVETQAGYLQVNFMQDDWVIVEHCRVPLWRQADSDYDYPEDEDDEQTTVAIYLCDEVSGARACLLDIISGDA